MKLKQNSPVEQTKELEKQASKPFSWAKEPDFIFQAIADLRAYIFQENNKKHPANKKIIPLLTLLNKTPFQRQTTHTLHELLDLMADLKIHVAVQVDDTLTQFLSEIERYFSSPATEEPHAVLIDNQHPPTVVSAKVARRVSSLNEHCEPTRSIDGGIHMVAEHKGNFYKTDSGKDKIDPGMEKAIWYFLTLLSCDDNEKSIAAPSRLVKLLGIPSKDGKHVHDRNPLLLVSKGAGLDDNGMSLRELLETIDTANTLLESHGLDTMSEYLKVWWSNTEREKNHDNDNNVTPLSTELLALYQNPPQKPPIGSEDDWNNAVKQIHVSFNSLFTKLGKEINFDVVNKVIHHTSFKETIDTLKLLKKNSDILSEKHLEKVNFQTLVGLSCWVKNVKKIFKNKDPRNALEEIQTLLRDKLDKPHTSKLTVATMLYQPADGKASNYRVAFDRDNAGNVSNIRIVAIDNDMALVHPIMKLPRFQKLSMNSTTLKDAANQLLDQMNLTDTIKTSIIEDLTHVLLNKKEIQKRLELLFPNQKIPEFNKAIWDKPVSDPDALMTLSAIALYLENPNSTPSKTVKCLVENYSEKDKQGNENTYIRIIGVEKPYDFNLEMPVPSEANPKPFMRLRSSKHYARMNSVLLFIPEIRDQLVDKDFRKHLLSKPAISFMTDWLELIEYMNTNIESMIKQKIFTKDDLAHMDLPLKLNAVVMDNLYDAWEMLQTILHDNESITHAELFEQLNDVLGTCYTELLKQFMNPLECSSRLLGHLADQPTCEELLKDTPKLLKKLALYHHKEDDYRDNRNHSPRQIMARLLKKKGMIEKLSDDDLYDVFNQVGGAFPYMVQLPISSERALRLFKRALKDYSANTVNLLLPVCSLKAATLSETLFQVWDLEKATSEDLNSDSDMKKTFTQIFSSVNLEVNKLNDEGNAFIHDLTKILSKNQDIEFAKKLLRVCVRASKKSQPINLDKKNKDGKTSLDLAVELENPGLFIMLVALGALAVNVETAFNFASKCNDQNKEDIRDFLEAYYPKAMREFVESDLENFVAARGNRSKATLVFAAELFRSRFHTNISGTPHFVLSKDKMHILRTRLSGETVDNMIKNSDPISFEQSLDKVQLGNLILTEMLLTPSDSSPDSFIASSLFESPTRLISVNKRFFQAHFGADGSFIGSFLYSLKETMNERFPQEVVDHFLSLTLEDEMNAWLDDCSIFDPDNEKTMYFQPGQSVWIYRHAKKIKEQLANNPKVTKLDLLKEIMPPVGLCVEHALNSTTNPLECYKAMTSISAKEKSLGGSGSTKATPFLKNDAFKKSHKSKETVEQIPEEAKKELNEFITEPPLRERIITNNDDIEAIRKLNNPDDIEYLLQKLDLNKISERAEKTLLARLFTCKMPLSRLILKSSNITKTHLIRLIKKSKNVLQFDLSDVECVDNDVVKEILKNCPLLVELNLSGCKKVTTFKPNNTVTLRRKQSSALHHLVHLDVSNMTALTEMCLDVSKLSTLNLDGSVRLKRLELQSPCLRELGLLSCHKLPASSVEHLLHHSPVLNTLRQNSEKTCIREFIHFMITRKQLSGNAFTENNMRSMIHINDGMRIIDLSAMPITDEDVLKLAKATMQHSVEYDRIEIQNCPNLTSLGRVYLHAANRSNEKFEVRWTPKPNDLKLEGEQNLPACVLPDGGLLQYSNNTMIVTMGALKNSRKEITLDNTLGNICDVVISKNHILDIYTTSGTKCTVDPFILGAQEDTKMTLNMKSPFVLTTVSNDKMGNMLSMFDNLENDPALTKKLLLPNNNGCSELLDMSNPIHVKTELKSHHECIHLSGFSDDFNIVRTEDNALKVSISPLKKTDASCQKLIQLKSILMTLFGKDRIVFDESNNTKTHFSIAGFSKHPSEIDSLKKLVRILISPTMTSKIILGHSPRNSMENKKEKIKGAFDAEQRK